MYLNKSLKSKLVYFCPASIGNVQLVEDEKMYNYQFRRSCKVACFKLADLRNP